MNIGKIVRIIKREETPRPIVIPVKDWPGREDGERSGPIKVPNWPVKVPEKVEVR